MSKLRIKLVDALSARSRLGEVMDAVEKGRTRFLVTRRGKAAVVILSVEDYMRIIIKQPEVLTKLQRQAEKVVLDQMSDEEIEAEIAAYRRLKQKCQRSSQSNASKSPPGSKRRI